MNTTGQDPWPHPEWCTRDGCHDGDMAEHRGPVEAWDAADADVEITVGLASLDGDEFGDTRIRLGLADTASTRLDGCEIACDVHLTAGDVDRLIAELQTARAQLGQ